MKQIADISIFNDLSNLAGPESAGQGGSSEPMVGSNLEYNMVREARNLQTQCNELMQQLDSVHEGRKRYRKDIQGKFLKAIDDLDERIYRLSQRAPEDTPALRGAFYDVAQAHDSLIHKYHRIYDNFTYQNHTPYMSREAYVNRPFSAQVPGPQHGPGNNGGLIPYGGLMRDDGWEDTGGHVRALDNIPMVPETALASSAAVSLVKMHQNFKNWYKHACDFFHRSEQMQERRIPLSPRSEELQDYILKKVEIPVDGVPKPDMMDIWTRSN